MKTNSEYCWLVAPNGLIKPQGPFKSIEAAKQAAIDWYGIAIHWCGNIPCPPPEFQIRYAVYPYKIQFFDVDDVDDFLRKAIGRINDKYGNLISTDQSFSVPQERVKTALGSLNKFLNFWVGTFVKFNGFIASAEVVETFKIINGKIIK
jgi:hypothetical protein